MENLREVKKYKSANNSGYAVHLRLPQPLRTLHTHNSLTEILHAALRIFKNKKEIILGR